MGFVVKEIPARREPPYSSQMKRFVRAALLICLAAPAAAAEFEEGVWRGAINVENPRAKEARIETSAALHISAAGNQLFVEKLGKAVPVVELSANRNGTFDLTTGGTPVIELRGIRLSRDGFEATAVYENEISAPLSGRASFSKVRPLSPPPVRAKCDAAPATLSGLCGVWSGISLRGQPKLLVIDAIVRNPQKVAWELKARQSWGGDSDLASAGMSFPYTEYITGDTLPGATLSLRTTGRLSYRFEFDGEMLAGGHIAEPADHTIYTRAKR